MEKEKITEYAMAYLENHECHEELDESKTIEFAMKYLQNRIEYHEEFLKNYDGDKTSLAQVPLMKRYKRELEELERLKM